jgi:hypothetical protein
MHSTVRLLVGYSLSLSHVTLSTESDSSNHPVNSLIDLEHSLDVSLISSCRFTGNLPNLSLQSWISSLPEHLRFSEENLQVQLSMFETSSNTGAWCFCCMHVLHASVALALNVVGVFSSLFTDL